MRLTVKILQGSECSVNVSESSKVCEVKACVEQALNVPVSSQRLVYKGKTLSAEELGVSDGGKIHLMVKKGEGVTGVPPAPGSSHTPASAPALDFFMQLDSFLGKHLTQEQTDKVVNEFRKNCQLMVDSMNFEDIERFAASNCTKF
ncbi:Ubiquitin-like protein 4A [Chionoecetes opilio]|uniref:Ubiquitin-like protein 4A n=1 Tax=Chionoecetes opilio TaxID=41210 RepID=A0A8J4YMT4_CHIOP|nr:Ubiquitin-like protein 4A [Chionoecetes opilio]